MNKILISILLVAAIMMTACTEKAKIANPASKYCEDNGGTLEIKTAADGSQSGYCTLTDGTVCEEWAYMRGECQPDKTYVSTDLEQCKVIRFMCIQGKQPFQDEKGCGCEPITANTDDTESTPPDGKLKAYDCTAEQRDQPCTREYMPVCGQVQVQCIRAPCPPIMQTFSNKCEACSNSLTISYTEGACEENNAAGGTVLAGTDEEQCTAMGGAWTGYDCEGITAEQCQEIGGTFNECASACRNDPTAEICTLQCVIVCQFPQI